MKILIVDRDKGVAEILRDSLEGHDCILAHDGDEASKVMASEQLDFAVTGLDMLHGGGERVLSELSTRNVPAFVFTGNPLKDCNKFFVLGAKGIYFKPEMDDMLEAIKRSA